MNSAAGGAEAAAAKKKKKKRKKKGDPYALAVPKPTGPQPSRSVWDAVLGVNSPRRNGDNAVGLTGAGNSGWDCGACNSHNGMVQLYCTVCGGRAPKSTVELETGDGLFRHEGRSMVSVTDGEEVRVPDEAEVKAALKEQTLVWCRFRGGGCMYPCTLCLQRQNGSVDVRYLSEGQRGHLVQPPKLKEWSVQPDLLRVDVPPPEPERLEEGQRVKAKQRGTAFFMPAKVIRARHNDTYDLMFGGGLKEYAIPRQLMATGDYPVVRGSACPSGTEYISECLRTYDPAILALEQQLVKAGLVPPPTEHEREMHRRDAVERTRKLAAAEAKRAADARRAKGAGKEQRRRPSEDDDDMMPGAARRRRQAAAAKAEAVAATTAAADEVTTAAAAATAAAVAAEAEFSAEAAAAPGAAVAAAADPAEQAARGRRHSILALDAELTKKKKRSARKGTRIVTHSERTFALAGGAGCPEDTMLQWLERCSAGGLKVTQFESASLGERMVEGRFRASTLHLSGIDWLDGDGGAGAAMDAAEAGDEAAAAATAEVADPDGSKGRRELGVCSVAAGIKGNHTLTTVRLRRCGVGDVGAEALAEVLYRGNKTLLRLDLGENAIGLAGAGKLARTVANNRTLQSLRIGGNEHGNQNFNTFGTEGSGRLLKSLRTNGSLVHLDLGGNAVGDDPAVVSAFAHLEENPVITTLELMNCGMGNNAAAALATALAAPLCNLTELRLAKNRIGPDGSRALGGALRRNRTLTNLDLRFNRIGVEGTGWLDDEFAAFGVFADALRVNRCLTRLDLSSNCVWDEGATRLADALAHNCGIEVLGLRLNNIGDTGAMALAGALGRERGHAEELPTLTELDLRNNTISDDGALALGAAVAGPPGCTMLTALHLSNNGISMRVRGNAITPVLHRNAQLTEKARVWALKQTEVRWWLIALGKMWVARIEGGKGMFASKGVWTAYDDSDSDSGDGDSLAGADSD
jgi:Ran GTPase-activating protein (RanGAP) involved in mRNA processing and transport